MITLFTVFDKKKWQPWDEQETSFKSITFFFTNIKFLNGMMLVCTATKYSYVLNKVNQCPIIIIF